jgi:hypothetical protein
LAAVVASLVCAVLLAACGFIPPVLFTLPASPTAATTPSTYSIEVDAARTLAIREVRAEAVNNWSTMYNDRKASACFVKHWPSLSVYERWWTSNWGPVNAGPGDLPSKTAPLKVLSASGDDQHQIVVIEALDPTFLQPPVELFVLRQFASGWAILNWLPYKPSDVSNGSAPYRVPDWRWDPCLSVRAYTPGFGDP